MLTPWKKIYDQPRQHIKKQIHYFVNKDHLGKAMVFPVVLYGRECCFCTVVLEKTLESPLDCKEIQPVHSKGDQSWVFIGRRSEERRVGKECHTLFWGAPKSLQMVTAAMKLKDAYSLERKL